VSARCPEPLDTRVLADYWFGELPAPDQDRVEEHLMECHDCSRSLRELVAIGDGVRRLTHQGALHVVVSPSFLEAASRRGLRVREYRVPPGGRVACTVTAEDDLLVSRLQGDFSGVTRLDLVAQTEGQPEERVEDLPVNPSAHELIVAQAMPAMRAMGSCVVHLRLVAADPNGDRVLGEYTFAHTSSKA
jgi:anti-sigma factor RsiW